MQVPNFDTTINLNLLIAVVAVIVAISIALYFQWWRNRKRLSYLITARVPLVSTPEAMRDRLEIKFHGRTVYAVTLVVVRLVNDGYKAIKKADFDEPVKLSLSGGAELLSVVKGDSSPENLDTKPKHLNQTTVEISPALFNRGDYSEFALFVNGDKFEIHATARIEDVSEIRQASSPANGSIGTFVLGAGVSVILSLIIPSLLLTSSAVATVAIAFILVVVAAIVLNVGTHVLTRKK
jgi:hypothetical protein